LVGGGPAIVVMTHFARFGFVAVLGGWWLAKLETREERWTRVMDGGRSLRAFFSVRVWPAGAAVVGIGFAVAALSFHEIESTVIVAPPGRQNLAQQMLDALHYAREEQLSAAAVNLLGLAVVGAVAAAVLVTVGGVRATPGGRRGRLR
jgi:ABC-type Fe3+ transport system permease subunit